VQLDSSAGPDVANKMGSSDVLEELYPLLLKRGKPE
jgi:hypothetical protein